MERPERSGRRLPDSTMTARLEWRIARCLRGPDPIAYTDATIARWPAWRNGIRGGLKNRSPHGVKGSNPFAGTLLQLARDAAPRLSHPGAASYFAIARIPTLTPTGAANPHGMTLAGRWPALQQHAEDVDRQSASERGFARCRIPYPHEQVAFGARRDLTPVCGHPSPTRSGA